MPDELRATAIAYVLGFGWSVIPVAPKGKTPLLQWTEYQTEAANEDVVMGWWEAREDANVGIVTGKVSGITVVDIDSKEGEEALAKYLPQGFHTPTAITQKGGRHLYFKHVPGLSNRVRAIPGVDVRNDGGFVVAPPSIGEKGVYSWAPDAQPGLTDLATMPQSLIDALAGRVEGAAPKPAIRDLSFSEGARNDSLFTVALAMVKGGLTSKDKLMVALRPIGGACVPPMPEKEISTVADSAIKRAGESKTSVHREEIEDWIDQQGAGEWDLKTLYVELGYSGDKTAMASARINVRRLLTDGVIAEGHKAGVYRRRLTKGGEMDLSGPTVGAMEFALPLSIHELIKIYPGNVLVFAGEQNVGKTAFMLDIIKRNMDKYPVDYFSSEMGVDEMKARLSLFGEDVKWNFHPFEANSHFNDLIERDHISVIDFLEVTDEFYLVGKRMSEIHEKLAGRGLAIIAIQKGKGKDFGRGGDLGMEKPRLYVTLERSHDLQGATARIIKAKSWMSHDRNPNGLIRPFNVIEGHRIVSGYDWMTVDSYDSIFGTENGRKKPESKKKMF